MDYMVKFTVSSLLQRLSIYKDEVPIEIRACRQLEGGGLNFDTMKIHRVSELHDDNEDDKDVVCIYGYEEWDDGKAIETVGELREALEKYAAGFQRECFVVVNTEKCGTTYMQDVHPIFVTCEKETGAPITSDTPAGTVCETRGKLWITNYDVEY